MSTNLHAQAAGSGKAALLHETGTDNEHVTALDRAQLAVPSPEQPFEKLMFGPGLTDLVERQPEYPYALEGLEGLPPQWVFERIQFVMDERDGEAMVKALLKDLGMLPEQATLQEADDLIAASYEGETPPQLGMRRLRAVGLLLAAGEDAWQVITSLPRNGPTSDFYAIDVARRAGQAVDADDPRVATYPMALR